MLCTLGEKTCGACCHGRGVSRARLSRLLRRHRSLFSGTRTTSPFALLWHELRARRGLDLVVAPILRIPLLGHVLRTRLLERGVCGFLAFLDDSETTVGCLLHPVRWGGVDRREAAFGLLAGIRCGASDYFCSSARRFEAVGPGERAAFAAATRDLDWFGYGRAATRFDREGEPSCR